MTEIDRSRAHPFNFSITFEKIKNTIFFCQEVTIPTMSISQIRMSMDAFDDPIPGDKMTFDDRLTLTVLMDEEFKAYEAIHDWMWEIRSPEDLKTHKMVKDCYSDAAVTVRGNNQQIIGRYHFVDCFPINLPGPQYKSTSQDDEIMVFTADFAFTRFKWARNGYPAIPT